MTTGTEQLMVTISKMLAVCYLILMIFLMLGYLFMFTNVYSGNHCVMIIEIPKNETLNCKVVETIDRYIKKKLNGKKIRHITSSMLTLVWGMKKVTDLN